MQFHTFYTSAIPESIVADHRACAEHLGLEVRHHSRPHSEDYDRV